MTDKCVPDNESEPPDFRRDLERLINRHSKESGSDTPDFILRERIAEQAHVSWSGWMEHLFRKSTLNSDGTVTIPSWAVERWRRQVATPYAALSEEEKGSDRDEADAYLGIFSVTYEAMEDCDCVPDNEPASVHYPPHRLFGDAIERALGWESETTLRAIIEDYTGVHLSPGAANRISQEIAAIVIRGLAGQCESKKEQEP